LASLSGVQRYNDLARSGFTVPGEKPFRNAGPREFRRDPR